MNARLALLQRAVDAENVGAVRAALAKLTEHEKDLLVECRTCGAPELSRCRGNPARVVHFGRRLLRLLQGIR